MPETKNLASYAELVQQLTTDNVPHQADPERQVVIVPATLGPTPTQVVLRWEKQTPLLQIIVPLPIQLAPEHLTPLAVAVARVNNAVPLPGFGLDAERPLLYYRLTCPREPDGSVRLDLVQRMLQSAVFNARDFFGAFRGVTQGAPPEDVLKAALADKQGPPSTP